MDKYPKIQTVFKRDMSNKGRIIETEFSCPEFEYLQNNEWLFTEKVDGTNVRVDWCRGVGRYFGGRTNNAQIPALLIRRLEELFSLEKMDAAIEKADRLCLFGEGFGAKIQKGGGNYKSDGVDFVLFDVKVDDWWLRREAVEDVAEKLSIKTVPILGRGSLRVMVERTRTGFNSHWGNFQAEGIVAKPAIELFNRKGERIMAKIKHKDFV